VSENERQQRMIERVQEDERLRGDLPDDAATALVEWASQRVATAAAEPTRPDAEVEGEVQAIRAAARAAARTGETDSQRLLALAETELAQHIAPAPVSNAPQSAIEQLAPIPSATTPVVEQPAPQAPAANLAAGVGAGAARAQPPATAHAAQATSTDVSQPAAPSTAAHSQHQQQWSWFGRWKPFASFLKRIRGGR
jgi:hypothetical protein